MSSFRTAREVQQDFALASGLRSEIIWDSLSADQGCILYKKLKTLIPDAEKHQNVIQRMRDDMFQSIWLQRKYTNRTLLSAIIYVLVVDKEHSDEPWDATTFSCHPVFRTRKCLNSDNTSAGCCMIFIDEHGRVYKNWKQFLENNVLPGGTLIAPANGVYTFTANDEVKLVLARTAVSRSKSKILKTSDSVASVTNLMATVPIVAGLACPISAPIVAVSSAVFIASTTYSTIRSAMQLSNRKKHGQSIALNDRAARKNWLGVAVGVVGIGGSGATKALTYISSAGKEITLATKIAMNGLNVSSILLSSTGIVDGIYDIILKVSDEQELSALDVLQLTSSLLVFTHSINNFKMASQVATRSSRSSKRNELVSQIRNDFKSVNPSNSPKKFDIIRTINEIPLKEVLINLHKINPNLNNGRNVLTAIGSTSMLPKIIQCFDPISAHFNISQLSEEFGHILVQYIKNFDNMLDVVQAMVLYFGDRTTTFLMKLALSIIEDMVNSMDQFLPSIISTETVLYKMLMHCVSNYKTFCYEFLEDKTEEIRKGIEKYFQSLNPINAQQKTKKCKFCNGFYYVCTL